MPALSRGSAILFAALGIPVLAVAAQTLPLGDFSKGLDSWAEREFAGATDYRIVEVDGERVLQARAEGTASALYLETEIDLEKTPWLHWRWRIADTLSADIDEKLKAGDDYPARVYVVRSGGLAFWRTRTINYIWSSNNPVGERWDNAFAGRNARMWPLDSGNARAGSWVHHARDIRADWLTAFGEEIDSLDGIAIMTDGDNTGSTLMAWYADIRFQDGGMAATE